MSTEGQGPQDGQINEPASGGGAPAPQPGTGTPQPPTFTQEQMNANAAAARREEAAKYADHDELKARAAKADELERERLTETERLQKDLAIEQQQTARLQGNIAEAMISAEIKVTSTTMGFVDTDAALALIDRSQVAYTTEGGVTGVKEALATLLEAKPFLKGTVPPTPVNMNAGPGRPGSTPAPLTESERATAQRMRIPEDKFAAGRDQKYGDNFPKQS